MVGGSAGRDIVMLWLWCLSAGQFTLLQSKNGTKNILGQCPLGLQLVHKPWGKEALMAMKERLSS